MIKKLTNICVTSVIIGFVWLLIWFNIQLAMLDTNFIISVIIWCVIGFGASGFILIEAYKHWIEKD